MKPIIVDIIVAMAGAALFALFQDVILPAPRARSWLALGAAFVLFFGLAALVQRYWRKAGLRRTEEQRSVGSDNQSEGMQTIEIEGVSDGRGKGLRAGSGNVSKEDQDIKIGKVDL